MPGGDRTGPLGQGPGTGRSLGSCSGFDTPGYTKGLGRRMGRRFGFGRGFGRRRGFRSGWDYEPDRQDYIPGNPRMPSLSKNDEIKLLRSQSEALKRSQEEITKRLGELEKEQ